MQYIISLPSSAADTRRFATLLSNEDPSASIDRAANASMLHLSTCLSQRELLTLAGIAGLLISTDAIAPLRSECCGCCGG